MVAVALVFYAGLRGGSAPVLAVARQVPAGQVLVAEDLKVVDVELGDGVASIPAAQLAEVTGRVASGPLVPGQLLVAGSVTAGPVVGPGEALIGLVLTPGRYPPGLKEGDRYQLVDLSVAPGGAAPLGRVVAVRPSESAWV